MSGRASAGQVKELALGVGHGIPADISAEDAGRNLADMSQIHRWLQLGLKVDLAQVDMAAIGRSIRPKILKLITNVTLPAIEMFSALDHFQVGEVDGVKIGWIGDNFQNAFLTGNGKVETEVAEATLRIHQLSKGSVDDSIIAELGGEGVAETTLAQIWEMLKVQGRGQKGNLLVNDCANIFYVRDARGDPWKVDCYWYSDDGDWYVEAFPVTYPFRWGGSYQVVSR